MEDVIASGDGFAPARVIFKIGGEEGETVARAVLDAAFHQHLADLRFALEVADSGADLMAGGEEMDNTMAADESGSAGDQNGAHIQILHYSNELRLHWKGAMEG